MSIHSEIKRRRKELKLSQAALAMLVSKRAGLEKALAWQSVQQWEREPEDATATAKSTAPERKLMPFVAEVLNTTVQSLMAGGADDAIPESFDALNGQEGRLVSLFRAMKPDQRKLLMQALESPERAAALVAALRAPPGVNLLARPTAKAPLGGSTQQPPEETPSAEDQTAL